MRVHCAKFDACICRYKNKYLSAFHGGGGNHSIQCLLLGSGQFHPASCVPCTSCDCCPTFDRYSKQLDLSGVCGLRTGFGHAGLGEPFATVTSRSAPRCAEDLWLTHEVWSMSDSFREARRQAKELAHTKWLRHHFVSPIPNDICCTARVRVVTKCPVQTSGLGSAACITHPIIA